MCAEDRQLMEAVQSGDKIAFRRLWEKYYPPTYRAVLRMACNPDDTKDILQEAFIRVHRSSKKFDLTRKFSNWFYTIVNHAYIDYFNRGKRRRKVISNESSIDNVEFNEKLSDRVASEKANPLETTLQIELKSQLWLTIEQLSFKHRQVIILCDIQGLSYEEIAEKLSIPKGTVMSRIHNAREKLRKLLHEYVK